MEAKGDHVQCWLDSAKAAREVASLTACALIRTAGDPEAAIALLAELEFVAPPETPKELDCVTIGQQAIRDAIVLRGGPHVG